MLTLLALALACAPQAPEYGLDRQILWQRSLSDALALSQAQQRPLLVAINADGESGSERIVREQYRDPKFVESTRGFVCVVGSIFRHNPRDYDDRGQRIRCPRLGEITCGEHIAMEPLVHERWFAGQPIELFGEMVERISPRHALVAPDGSKTLDMYLLFDMRELESALAQAAARAARPDATGNAWPSHRARLAFEDALANAHAIDLNALQDRYQPLLVADTPRHAFFYGTDDVGWTDALRRLQHRAAVFTAEQLQWLADFGGPTRRETAAALREAVLTGRCAKWIEPMARLGADQVGMRALVSSYFALGAREERASAFAGMHAALGDAAAHEIADALDGDGGAFDPSAFLAMLTASRPDVAHVSKPQDPLPSAGELERALEDADAARASDPRGDELFGRAALTLARRRMQDGATGGLDLLLQDADAALAKALEKRPDDAATWIDRARVAYYLARIDDEERHALAALKTLGFEPKTAPEALDDATVEALRWLGDACARQLAARAGRDSVAETLGILRGGRSLALAAASREADTTDWLSVASFFGALGRTRERVAFAEEGLYRFPESNDLRNELASALWAAGRPDLLVEKSEALARKFASSGASAWYAGFALVLQAESLRRCEDPDGAIAAYERGSTHFRRAIELEPSYRDSSEHYLAMSALGRGFAHLLANRQVEASRCVVEAATLRPQAFRARDGLDREAVDLIDGVLEWRASGPSPVDALAWIGGFAGVPSDEWILAISDAELREALRADQRGDRELGTLYLDAAIEAARVGVRGAPGPTDGARRTLAQAATIRAERLLASEGDAPLIAELLREAATALGRTPPADGADLHAWKALAAELRAELGQARPVLRAGR